MRRRGGGVPQKVTFAKFCMTKGGGGVQQKVTNDDKTLRGGIIIIIDCYITNRERKIFAIIIS